MTLKPVLPAETRIGHVHLKVADLDRALAFYQGILGFEITQRYGTQAVFLNAGAITTTSASTHGNRRAATRLPPAPPAFTTLPSCSPIAPAWAPP